MTTATTRCPHAVLDGSATSLYRRWDADGVLVARVEASAAASRILDDDGQFCLVEFEAVFGGTPVLQQVRLNRWMGSQCDAVE